MRQHKKHPVRRTIERVLVRCLAAPAFALVRLLSMRSARRLGNLLGTLLFLATPRRQRLADANLKAVFGDRFSSGERRRIRLAVSRNLCKLFLELFKLPTLDQEDIRHLVPVRGLRHLQAVRERGQGALLLTAHFGNWELLGARAAAEGLDVAVVARDASDAWVASLVNRSRTSAGMRVLGREDFRGMLRHLRGNGFLGILPDQHAKAGSIRLTFLGRPAWVPRGPATLALRTGCGIIVAFCVRQEDDGLIAEVIGEVNTDVPGDREEAVATIMERINQVIEEEIRKRPEQWLWLHDRWKDIPTPEQADEPSGGGAPLGAGCGG
jgi:KDO2-lipid IV(A) lauroyltransferase